MTTTRTVIYPTLSTILIRLGLGLSVPPALVTECAAGMAYRYMAHA